MKTAAKTHGVFANNHNCTICGDKILTAEQVIEFDEWVSADMAIGPIGDFDYFDGLCQCDQDQDPPTDAEIEFWFGGVS